jgi:hypothetical protein
MDFARMSLTTLNPIGGGTIGQMLAPTALDPGMQILENRGPFGNPLAPTAFPGDMRLDSQRAWTSTPAGYKSVAKWLNEVTGGGADESGIIDWQPSTFKVINDSLMGSAGRFLGQVGGAVWKGIDEEEEAKLKDIPIARQFAVKPKDTIGPQLYHERQAKVQRAKKALRRLTEGPERNLLEARKLRDERKKELQMVDYARDVERQIKSLRVRLRAADSRGDLKGREHWEKKIREAQRRFNETWKRRVGE